MGWRRLALVLAAAATACLGEIGETLPPGTSSEQVDDKRFVGEEQLPAFAPAPAQLKRLTYEQYANSVRDVLGDAVVVPAAVDLDPLDDGFSSTPTSSSTMSPASVENFESSALAIATQVMQDATLRSRALGCTPTQPGDTCIRASLKKLGQRLWRRPLESAELDAYVKLSVDAAADLDGAALDGMKIALATLLQSPSFLYRVELGEPDPNDASHLRYSNYEMAMRLSFLLANATPDDELLAAALNGELTTLTGLTAQAERLLAASEARPALMRFFRELLDINGVDALLKDATLYPEMTPALARSMQREMEQLTEPYVTESARDFLDLFVTRTTFVDPLLATLYGLTLPASAGATPVQVALPASSQRAGILTTAGSLAFQSNPVRTSPTYRGLFIRRRLLCDQISAAPANVDTSLSEPPAGGQPQTMRERMTRHRADPLCASCHDLIDPLGLGLESFDTVGRERKDDHGITLDLTGALDGVAFDGARELAQAVHDSPKLVDCITRRFFRHAVAHNELPGEERGVHDARQAFVDSGHAVHDLVLAIVKSDAFRFARLPEVP